MLESKHTFPEYTRQDAILLFGLLALLIARLSPALLVPGRIIFYADLPLFYGYETAVREALAAGQFPLWNPFYDAGSLTLANPQTAVLYPPAMLLRVLPIPAAFNVNAVLHIWLTGAGMYVVLRDLQLRRTAAMFGALTFTFSGFVFPRLMAGHVTVIYSIPWGLWTFAGYRRLLYHAHPGVLLWTVSSICFALLAGHPQYGAITLIPAASYFVYWSIRQVSARNWRLLTGRFGLSVLIVVISIGLCAPLLLPMLQLLSESARSSGLSLAEIDRYPLTNLHLTSIIMPFLVLEIGAVKQLGDVYTLARETNLYLGLLPFILLIAGFLRKQDRQQWLFTIYLVLLAIISFMLARGTQNALFMLVYRVISFVRVPPRFLYAWAFALVILVAMGYEMLEAGLEDSTNRLLRKRLMQVSILLVISIAVALYVNTRWVQAGGFGSALILFVITTALTVVGLLVVARNRNPVIGTPVALMAVLLLDLFIFAWAYINPLEVSSLYSPDSYLARLELDPAIVRLEKQGRSAVAYGIPIDYAEEALRLERFVQLHQLGMECERGSQLLAAGWFVAQEPLDQPGLQQIKQAGSDAYLYRCDSAWPRVYAAPAVKVVPDDALALETVASPEFDYHTYAVITTTGDAPNLPAQSEANLNFSYEFEAYTPNMIRVKVNADQAALIVFSEMYYPGWGAVVDNQPVPVWLANYAFRGVVVQPGEHVIELKYREQSLQTGIIVAMLSLCSLIVLAVLIGKYPRQESNLQPIA